VRVVFVGRDRVVWRQVVLYLVTLGIYRRVWLHRVNKELDGHMALGLRHNVNLVLLCLPVVGPSIVAFQTSGRVRAMLQGSGIRHGKGWLVWLATLVPIAGNLFHMSWTQTRLNRFWALERAHPERGVEIDVRLDDDPAFLVELGRAVRESYHPGSRFDQRRNERREKFQQRRATYDEVRRERAAVRAAGGSTPVLPWRRPKLPEARVLHVSCGRCDARFEVTQDPLADTPIVCPTCKLSEVLPSLRGDPLRGNEPVAVPTLSVKCPSCRTQFTGVRDLRGPTLLTCPKCGRKDTLPAPVPQEVAALARQRRS
jgi:predicted nucleic acid-binding Zn ribbon protein